MRQPFRSDDMIEVAGYSGVVQQLNMRTTILMTLDGNHIQIPNSTVFKNVITNFSTNPNRRATFVVGIAYDDSLTDAQNAIMRVLDAHPAVLDNPESLVLVDEMGPAAINLKVYFWYDASVYSPIKIRSSLIRLTKQALDDAGISIPDEAREVIFPQGVPILTSEQSASATESRTARATRRPTEPVTTPAERFLLSEDPEIVDQAAHSRVPEEGEDLLTPDGKP
jgi:small-conductance mechanosensitive channel